MKRMIEITLSYCLLAACAAVLSGCFGAAVMGVGAGAVMLNDRRISEVYLADQGIELRAAQRIGDKFGDKVHVNVTSYNRTLLLTGEVPDAATRDAVEKIAISVTEVRRISNELQIAGNSSLGARSNDSYITSKIKARFIDAARFSINNIKVVTEGGAVYLMGLVTQAEADAAVDVARTTGGVLRVVRVFEIVSDEQARKLDNLKSEPAQK
jgi:osmotically-inducible protein OsmY